MTSRLHFLTRVQRLARRRLALLLLTVMVALAGSSVALAQSSFGYDLACRNTVASGGGINTFPLNNAKMVGVLGQPVAGTSQSATFGVRGGAIQPFGASMTTGVSALAPSADFQADTVIALPLLSRFVRTIRGGC